MIAHEHVVADIKGHRRTRADRHRNTRHIQARGQQVGTRDGHDRARAQAVGIRHRVDDEATTRIRGN